MSLSTNIEVLNIIITKSSITIYISGLPHAHIIIQFTNMPDYNNKQGLSEWIDNNITAEFPIIDDMSSEEDKIYAKKVQSYMIHKCSSGSVNSCLDSNGRCTKNFTNNMIRNTTTFDERGFPQYKRSTEKSLNVVPHNKKILMSWDGHANVEFAGSTFLVLYLYKVAFTILLTHLLIIAF